jgi:hypothetical protein
MEPSGRNRWQSVADADARKPREQAKDGFLWVWKVRSRHSFSAYGRASARLRLWRGGSVLLVGASGPLVGNRQRIRPPPLRFGGSLTNWKGLPIAVDGAGVPGFRPAPGLR